MFGLFEKKPVGEKVVLKIGGMHCTSCAMNIDGALEDTDGVLKATTNYAKSEVTVHFEPKKIKAEKIAAVIVEQGYEVIA